MLRFNTMQRLSPGLFLALACLVGCDVGSTTAPEGSAGKPASGGANAAGSSSTPGGAGNSGGQAGSTAGAAGTSNGGAAGASGGGNPGGASGAAGSAGSSVGGAGGGGGGCQGALLCEDFESYTGTPGDPWKVTKNAAGNVVIDGAQHVSGSKAVKFSTTGAMSYQQAFISLEKIFPVANNAFYGRMMIYATAAANDGVHWTMIEGEGANTAQGIENAQVRYGGQQEKSLMANYDSSGKQSDCWAHSSTKMPEAKWACMEWYFDGATNTQKFWLDGKAIEDLTVMSSGQGCISQDTGGRWIYPSFSRLNLGWTSYQTDDPRQVWIDDVALGAEKLGCPQ